VLTNNYSAWNDEKYEHFYSVTTEFLIGCLPNTKQTDQGCNNFLGYTPKVLDVFREHIESDVLSLKCKLTSSLRQYIATILISLPNRTKYSTPYFVHFIQYLNTI
jgi:hypothetical protein